MSIGVERHQLIFHFIAHLGITSPPSHMPLFFCSFYSFLTAGPFPVVKQEQLSPRSSSSQADNLSMQAAHHDSAGGRGRWPTFPLLYSRGGLF